MKFRRAKAYAVEELSDDTLKAIALLDEQTDAPQLAKSRD